MTTLTPDSWELPSYLAGDVVPMEGRHPRGGRNYLDPLEDAKVITHPSWKIRRGPSVPAPESTPAPTGEPDGSWLWGQEREHEIEPYDPSTYHEPAELYNQRHIETLEGAGFHPSEAGVWQRHIRDKNDHVVATHTIAYAPGSRINNGSLQPWHVSTDPDEVGAVHKTLRSAIKQADDHAASLKTSVRDNFKLGVREQTPAQIAAQKWLDDQDHEEWMRAREGDPDEGYTHWEPTPGDYSYSDQGDAVGQSFQGDEAQSHMLPGSHYDPANNWETGQREEPSHPSSHWQSHEYDDDAGEMQRDRYDHVLGEHNFNWEPKDPTAGQPGNPLHADTPGKWVNHQLGPNGEHFATHTITNDEGSRPGQWKLHTELGDHGHPVTSSTSFHGEGESGLDYALEKHKKNSMETMLPAYGYKPVHTPGRPDQPARYWTRTDPAPRSNSTSAPNEPYTHEISPSDAGGFFGQSHMTPTVSSYASNGTRSSIHADLADLVREHHQVSQGLHPGGSQDHRLTSTELLSHPSVSSVLGKPSHISDNFYNDNKVGSARWQLPHPDAAHAAEPDSIRPINAEATYNWPKGGYDIKYTHDGIPLYPAHPHFPAGAPTHVPGRQTSLDLESAR